MGTPDEGAAIAPTEMAPAAPVIVLPEVAPIVIPDPAPAAAPAAEPPVPAVSPYLGAAVIFIPPINANHPGPVQVPAQVIAVHDEHGSDVTIFTENGDEYRCPLHFVPVEEVGSGLLAVLERQS